jgi:hypothetical protein
MRYEYLKIYMKSEIQNRNYSTLLKSLGLPDNIPQIRHFITAMWDPLDHLAPPVIHNNKEHRERGNRILLLPPDAGKEEVGRAAPARWGHQRWRLRAARAPGEPSHPNWCPWLGPKRPVVVRPRQPTACRPALRRRSTAEVKTVRRGALEGRRGMGNAMVWSVRVEGGRR